MGEHRAKYKTPEERATDEAIEEIFGSYDKDNNGVLDIDEATAFFKEVV